MHADYACIFVGVHECCKLQATHLLPLTGKQILKALHADSECTLTTQSPLQGQIEVKRTGDTNHAAAWQNERLVAVAFPSAFTLAQQRRLAQASKPERLLIVITSHSETGHQVASRYVTSLQKQ